MKINTYSSQHAHTGDSNMSTDFADSSTKLENLIITAKEKGLDSIAITEHEIMSNHIEAQELAEKHDFKVILGNEIYLIHDWMEEILNSNDYDSSKHYYPHFILLALDEIGHSYLRELSTIAWVENSFTQSGITRRPTKVSDLRKVIEEKGHLVATSSCLGGQIAKHVFADDNREDLILDYIYEMQELFGEDNFFLEIQPSLTEEHEQHYYNLQLIKYSEMTNAPLTIATDSHYLDKKLWELHKNFIMSDGGKNDEDQIERLYDIYGTAYLMSFEQLKSYFENINFPMDKFYQACQSTLDISNRVKGYTLKKSQKVPRVPLQPYKIEDVKAYFPYTGIFKEIIDSDNNEDKYLLYRLMKGMKDKTDFLDYQPTIERLIEELTEIREVSKLIKENLGSYFVTMEKIIDIIWDDEGGNSIVGIGRGSVASSVIAFILGIIQTNPIKMPVEMPFWRFINLARVELPDYLIVLPYSNVRMKEPRIAGKTLELLQLQHNLKE